MNNGQSQSFRAVTVDPTQGDPTAQTMMETLSRMKAASAASPSSRRSAPTSPHRSPLAQLFPAPTEHAGPFGLVCEIASGGMATVYLAVDRRSAGPFVAVKRIHPHLAQDQHFAEMFIDEARVAAGVKHPAVCKVIDFGRTPQSYYIAMEFLQGEPIAKLLAAQEKHHQEDPRSPRFSARIVANLAEGLYAAHTLRDEMGRNLDVIHRDVTPHNLFVLYDGTVRVTDFGIAWARRRLHHTEGQQLKGKLAYMSPEQLQRSQIDHRVDVWALGVVLWEMLAGQKLFRCSSEGETVVEVMGRRIPKPSDHNQNVSPELDAVVLRALSRNRAERYQSARELSEALEQYLARSGAPVGPTELAGWMNEIFPTGAARGREMLAAARKAADQLPRFEATENVSIPKVRPLVSLSPATPFTADDSDDHENTTQIFAPTLLTETLVSMKAVAFAPFRAPETARSLTTERPPARVNEVRRARARSFALVAGAAVFAVGLGETALLHLPFHSDGGQVASLSAAPLAGPARVANVAPPARAEDPKVTTASFKFAPVTVSLDSALPAPTELARGSNPSKARGALSSRGEEPQFSKGAVPTPTALEPGVAFLSTPGGSAEVFENGQALGHTPRQFEFAPGFHTLLVKSDSDAQSVTIQVKAGGSLVVKVPLASAPASAPAPAPDSAPAPTLDPVP